MSVYKQEATRGVAIQEIYIPLTIIPEDADPGNLTYPRTNTSALLSAGSRNVVLGDPGSGKSTLLRFLALSGSSKALQTRYQAKADKRLPLIIVLRRYADELKSRPNLPLLDYIVQMVQADFSLNSADLEFFEYYLESGQSILLLDGLDELPNPQFKQTVRDRIRTFLGTYPGNTAIVTSRIVGYDEPLRFDRAEFRHVRIAPLRLPEMEQFVSDWYRVRIENKVERDRNVGDLLRILRDDEHVAIRQLAENPLLLTIIALVHRIDAVLPDERVVLYQKCTETLLNTWHTWKYRETEQRSRGRVERRNRARMEAIAYWMQCRSVDASKNARAVVAYEDLHKFLTAHIAQSEHPVDAEIDPADSAAEFIDFIKKRAGLLIEAGDGQFSFVHLTFQEYLTATHIITINEAAGVKGIWNSIEATYRQVRWHEVIRLLVGGLKSAASQSFILEQILVTTGARDATTAELLGGLVLDGIEPAEEKIEAILKQVVSVTAKTRSFETCRRLLRLLRAWRRKESFNEELLRVMLRREAFGARNEAVVALLPSLGLPKNVADELLRDLNPDAFIGHVTRIFLARGGESEMPNRLRLGLQDLVAIEGSCIVTSPSANAAGAVLQAFLSGAAYELAAEYLFQMLLTSLTGGPFGGPFYEFIRNLLVMSSMPVPERELETEPAADRASPLMGALYSLWQRKRKSRRHGQLDNVLWSPREVWEDRLRRQASKSRVSISTIFRFPKHHGESLIDATALAPRVSAFVQDVICECLSLKKVQWKCAVNLGLLPAAGTRLWMFGQQMIESLVARMRTGGTMLPGDEYFAASLRILESWCCIYKSNAFSNIFPELGAVMRELTHPAIRVGNAVRDLACGDVNDPLLLVRLAADKECRPVLAQAGWVATRRTSRIESDIISERSRHATR